MHRNGGLLGQPHSKTKHISTSLSPIQMRSAMEACTRVVAEGNLEKTKTEMVCCSPNYQLAAVVRAGDLSHPTSPSLSHLIYKPQGETKEPIISKLLARKLIPTSPARAKKYKFSTEEETGAEDVASIDSISTVDAVVMNPGEDRELESIDRPRQILF
jgi:hypothetical protein